MTLTLTPGEKLYVAVVVTALLLGGAVWIWSIGGLGGPRSHVDPTRLDPWPAVTRCGSVIQPEDLDRTPCPGGDAGN